MMATQGGLQYKIEHKRFIPKFFTYPMVWTDNMSFMKNTHWFLPKIAEMYAGREFAEAAHRKSAMFGFMKNFVLFLLGCFVMTCWMGSSGRSEWINKARFNRVLTIWKETWPYAFKGETTAGYIMYREGYAKTGKILW